MRNSRSVIEVIIQVHWRSVHIPFVDLDVPSSARSHLCNRNRKNVGPQHMSPEAQFSGPSFVVLEIICSRIPKLLISHR